jgi:hypothetical protein
MQERELGAEDDLAAFHLPSLKFFPEKQIYRGFHTCPICTDGLIFTPGSKRLRTDTRCDKCGSTDNFVDSTRHSFREDYEIVVAGITLVGQLRRVVCLECKHRQLIQDEGIIEAECCRCGLKCRV